MDEALKACSRLFFCIAIILGLQSAPVRAEQPTIADDVLKNQLNNLESQAIQRRGREPKVLDLLNRQDDRIAGQKLNTLKTRNPRSTASPLLERQLDRSRRTAGSAGRR